MLHLTTINLQKFHCKQITALSKAQLPMLRSLDQDIALILK